MNNLGFILFSILTGHYIGDYIFQNDYMALNKKQNNEKGPIAASLHCFVYTIIVCIFVSIAIGEIVDFWYFVYIFGSHWILDRFDFIEKWFKFFGKTSWDTNLPKKDGEIDWEATMNVKQIIQSIFGAIVYVSTDMAAHLTLMYFITYFYYGV